MKKILVLGNAAAKIGAVALTFGLVACGDDGASNSGTNGEKGEVITLADGSGETVCDDKLDGWVAEAVGKDFRRCQNGEWTKITANEASAEDEIIGGVTLLQSSSSSVIPGTSSSVIPSEVEGSSSSKGGSSVIYECPDGTVVANQENCKTPSSSASETPGTSSGVIPGTDPEPPSEVKADGYYGTNCPEGLDCKYATTTEYLNSSKTYGEILDTRDGQVYKTIVICDKDNKNCQTWMAQNLNYAYTGVKYNLDGYTSDSTSWCGGGSGTIAGDCSIYGRLYTWAAAMDSAGIVDSSGAGKGCGYGKTCTVASASSATKVRGVCPSGWHLPSNAEWSALYTNVGGTSSAGQKLKANTSLWNGKTSTNVYGFSVLPAGLRYNYDNYGVFTLRGNNADFWSSTEYERSSINAWDQYFNYNSDDVGQNYYGRSHKENGFSVRCLKD